MSKDYREGINEILIYDRIEKSDQYAYCKNCAENFFYKTTPPLINSAVEFDFCSKCRPTVEDMISKD